jgi:hypothetical protein
MKNMRFDDLGLLLRVIETRMVLHILIHGLQFPVLQCDIFTYSVSIFIHPPYVCLKCELLMSSLDLIACIIIALSYILLLVRLNLFATCGVHRSYYTCFLCGLICSSLCVIVPWLRLMFALSWCLSPV